MAILIGPYFFKLSTHLSDESKQRRNAFAIYRSIAAAIAFLIVFTDWFVKGLWSFGDFRYQPLGGPLYIGFVFFFFWCNGHGYVVALKKYLKSIGLKKKQLKLFLISTGIGYGASGELFLQGLGLAVAPHAVFFMFMYVVILGYAIHRYKFLDIPVLVKKSLVFAGIFGVIMAIVGTMTTISQSYIGRYINMGPSVSAALGVIAAILFYDPTRRFLVNVTDRYLFQKKESIKAILNRLSSDIVTILDIDQVGGKILSTLRESLRLESGAIVLKQDSAEGYQGLDAFGLAAEDISYATDDFFIRYLVGANRIINLESPAEKESLPTIVLGKLQDLKAVICMPLFLHNDLIGLLTLGRKKSDEEFTREELEYLPTVASQVAIALSNARLYDILKKSQIDFAQQAKMAAIGTLSAGISHEIKNPLNHMRLAIGMLRVNRKLGVYKSYSREKFEEEVFDALEKIDENISRATEVIERLSSFAKKPKELKIEAISLEKAMESAFKLLDRELEHYGIAVKKEYSENLPFVYSDMHAMEDILLNLLVNARHAIGEKGTIVVSTRQLGSDVELCIQDTGVGIPPENLERIFDPFFTTKDTSRNSVAESIKGTGLGLFIVRELIKKFGGRITVESEIGKGTTFRLVFPVAQAELAKSG
jgi:signal transduction histidine kinase